MHCVSDQGSLSFEFAPISIFFLRLHGAIMVRKSIHVAGIMVVFLHDGNKEVYVNLVAHC